MLRLRLRSDPNRQDLGTVERSSVSYRGLRKGQSQKGHIEMSKPCTANQHPWKVNYKIIMPIITDSLERWPGRELLPQHRW